MVESSKDKRVVFPPGEQTGFLRQVAEKLSVTEVSYLCNCSERTVRDWRREKFSMPITAVQNLSVRTGVPIPKDIRINEAYSHIAEASRMGAAATIEKYGRIPHDEKRRKEQWDAWWESTGKFKKNTILESKSVYRPKQSAELAEFIGIMMGDGGLSKYQVMITLHHIDDLEYAGFVMTLIKKLFKLEAKIYHSPKNSVNDITVSRKQLVEYLHELGLPMGNKVKQQFDMPEWIKLNRNYSIACLRGLVDTDGCIFTHKYRVKGTWYAYKKLSFTSASQPLRHSVYDFLLQLEFHPRIAGEDVRLDRIEDMRRYFKLIGSHNPKHLRRYESTLG